MNDGDANTPHALAFSQPLHISMRAPSVAFIRN